MVLDPQDIHDKEFTVKMRGYSIDEVNDFLDQIIKDYQITIKQNNDLRSALSDTQSQLKHFNKMKNSLNQSILVAQEAADNVKSDAEGQSKELLSNAKKKAEKIIGDAESKAQKKIDDSNATIDKLLIESRELKKRTEAFRIKIQSLLEGQLKFTKNSSWDDIVNGNQDLDEKLQERMKSLDNLQALRVKSKGNSIDDRPKDVVIFYPDGSNK